MNDLHTNPIRTTYPSVLSAFVVTGAKALQFNDA
jgi:hypothetical protein